MLVSLFQGVLYRESAETLWQSLLDLQARVRDYCSVIGLELILDEAEGYAYLRQRAPMPDAPDAPDMPRLVQRRPLSFPVSLILVLLRKKLAEFDATGVRCAHGRSASWSSTKRSAAARMNRRAMDWSCFAA